MIPTKTMTATNKNKLMKCIIFSHTATATVVPTSLPILHTSGCCSVAKTNTVVSSFSNAVLTTTSCATITRTVAGISSVVTVAKDIGITRATCG